MSMFKFLPKQIVTAEIGRFCIKWGVEVVTYICVLEVPGYIPCRYT
jgi:hypothetical protein